MTKKESHPACPIGKQSKAEKKLYAKIRHSKKQAKAATRQGGYWRDIEGESNPQQNEHRLLHPALIQSGNVTVWIRPDGKELQQQIYRAKDTMQGIATGHRYDKAGSRNLKRIEATRCLFEGDRPAMSAPAIAAFRLACREYLSTLPLRFDGNRARVAAERLAARRLIKAWQGNVECPVTLAITLLHGPETALQIAGACKAMTAALAVDHNSGRVQAVGYYENAIAAHHLGRVDEETGQTSYLHCIHARWSMDILLSWCREILGKR